MERGEHVVLPTYSVGLDTGSPGTPAQALKSTILHPNTIFCYQLSPTWIFPACVTYLILIRVLQREFGEKMQREGE